MKKRQTENRIARGFAAAKPDVYNEVASQCPTRAAVKTRSNWGWKFATCALAVVLVVAVVLGGVGLGINDKQNAVAASVILDVNPSVSIQLNSKSRVVKVEPLNEDGVIIIGNMDFNGVQLDVTVNALIGSMLRNGYIRSDANSVLVSVDSAKDDYDALVALVSSEITLKLRESEIEASVVSQWIKDTDSTNALAAKYGISVGKAQLIGKILANSAENSYTEEELAKLTINELNIILGGLSIEADDDLAQSGTASAQSYIGRERALEVAFAKVESGLKEENVLGLKCKLDFDDGMMVYEVEFYYGVSEYEFEIGAISGEIISFERETAQYTPDTTLPEKTLDELKAQALLLAGVAEEDIDSTTVESERCFFWGRNEVYSLWLTYNNTYFEYEIDIHGYVLYSFEQQLDLSADKLMDRNEIRNFLVDQGELQQLQQLREYRVVAKLQQNEEGDDILVYIVTFRIDEVSYTYTIDALNKTILSTQTSEKTDGKEDENDKIKDWFGSDWYDDWDDWDDWNFDFDDRGLSGWKKQPTQGEPLTEEQIKTYLLNQLRGQFGVILPEDITEWEAELEGQVYEVEFEWNNREFECTVDAFSGMLIRGTWDYVDGYWPSQPGWHHGK